MAVEAVFELIELFLYYGRPEPPIGFNTGTGKPAVFPKRVTRVRVRYWILAYRGTPCTHTAVSRVFTGILVR